MMRQPKRKKRRKLKLRYKLILLLAALMILLPNKMFAASIIQDFAGWGNDCQLILVNQNNYIPSDYEVELVELPNNEKVDLRIYPKLQEMFAAARADGLSLVVNAGYRTQEQQQRLLDEKIEAYRNEGYVQAEAHRLALEWVAAPGTSEHQLGIAVDIIADATRTANEDAYNWLAENAHKYGFIRRYPEDKTEITGIINEPWHYRYVGRKAAAEIYTQQLCLEEYLAAL